MKKNICLAFVVLMLLSISACRMPSFGRPQTPDPPYGVWVSEEPRMVLFLKPQYRILEDWPWYIGLYTQDSIEIKIFAHFGPGTMLEIYNLSGLRDDGGISGAGWLLAGSYRMVRDEIHYSLFQSSAERLGVQTIVLHRVEEYDPIDPYYWFPHFFPREESEVDTP